ncbi:dihydroorotase [Fusobacterium animalis ATCC 51191]|uniref:Dihydroorotase n=3 Tax=Fusobacterium TaxID=848 RepID=F9EPW8_9FUSO|nr:dihydroorotase [Fusobacterium animalis ATCC 51191]
MKIYKEVIFMSTILIKNGTLIDGSGSKRYLADILIENEK